jgi:hypothetical protein
MGNINNYNFNRIDLRLSNNEYWDLFLNTDDSGSASSCSGLTSGDCFVVWYDFNNPQIYSSSATSATTIYSLVSWDNAVNTGYTFNTIGLTGIDNGLITFDKTPTDTTNQALLSALTGTTLVIPSGDTRLVLNRVTGTTNNVVYPMSDVITTATTGNYKELCGGFYQGYYKIDGSTYEVLPTRVSDAWSAEFWLNKTDDILVSATTTEYNFTSVPLFKPAFNPAVQVTINNHGLNVGDIVNITGTTDDVGFYSLSGTVDSVFSINVFTYLTNSAQSQPESATGNVSYNLTTRPTCNLDMIDSVFLRTGDQTPVLSVYKINHGLSIGDVVKIENSPIISADTSYVGGYSYVNEVFSEDSFNYISYGYPTPGAGYSKADLTVYEIDEVYENTPIIAYPNIIKSVSLTGLSVGTVIQISDVQPSSETSTFVPTYDGYSAPDIISGLTEVETVSATGFTYSIPFVLGRGDTGTCTVTTYKIKQKKILNDLYPENKGIFFYMGTRAENKFWNQFDGADTGCTSACTITSTACTDTISAWCTVEKESNVSIIGDYGVPIPLDPPQVTTELITNNFLIYGRARDESPARLTGDSGTLIYNTGTTASTTVCSVCGGSQDGLGTKTVCCYDGGGVVVVRTAEHVTNNQNPFLVYGRGRGQIYTGDTCCQGPNDGLGSETSYTFSGFTSPITEIDYNLDIIDNALAFRIKDDGSIGYRLLTVTGSCSGDTYHSGTTIEEGYSVSGVVSANTWSYIAIRFVMPYMDECELSYLKPRKGKLMFYINGKLKYTVNEFDEVVGRRLNEYKSKQVGVPFNFSLGGGSQGLIDSQTFDGLDPADRGLPIETNFGGSFIGYLSQFKFNICDLSWCDIQNNYKMDASRYGIIIKNYGHC